jgi:hypothetical protein
MACFLKKKLRKLRQYSSCLKSVATWLPARDSFNGQIIELSPFICILTWDSRQPRYTADLKKTTLGLTPLRSNSSIDMQAH